MSSVGGPEYAGAVNEGPERIVRRFASATNLVVSGMPTAVVGDDDAADGLRALLRRLGAVLVDVDRAAYVYVTGRELDWYALRDGVIVIARGEIAALDLEGLTLEATRAPLQAMRTYDGRLIRLLDLRHTGRTPSAAARLAWAHDFMPACAAQTKELIASGAVRGRRFGISMVLEPKTANLAFFLRDAGADVVLYAHADETDEDIATSLRGAGFTVHASTDERAQFANAMAFLDEGIEFLLDDGSHLIRLAELDGVPLKGAAEETTSGLRPLRAMGDRLTTPVIAVNDAHMKTRFDNRYGTGQSCVFAIADLLDPLDRGFAGARVAVIGFGPVGEGVAQHAAALGADVQVVEHDPVRALEAAHAGYRTGPLEQADIVISATGEARTITAEALRAAAPGTVFAVAGGVVDEIDLAGSTLTARAPKVDETDTGALVLDRGGCINITAAEGNPVQIMDYSFAAQLAAAGLLAQGAYPEPGVHPLPREVDERIAAALLGTSAPAPAAPEAVDWHPARFPETTGRGPRA